MSYRECLHKGCGVGQQEYNQGPRKLAHAQGGMGQMRLHLSTSAVCDTCQHAVS
jgi:hypothetical protein